MEVNVDFLEQLVNSLEKSEIKLDEFVNEKDAAKFNSVKKLMITISEKINEAL